VAYREWRASTFALLFPGKGLEIDPAPYMQEELDKQVKDVQREIWHSLWTYAQRDMPKEAKGEAKDSLKDIALAAVCFDIDMKKHTAEMSFFSHSCRVGSEFNPERMEEMIDRTGEGRIRLVVSPPFYKEIYTDNVEKSALLKKAQVCSSIVERVPRNGYQKAISPFYTSESSRSVLDHQNEGQRHPSVDLRNDDRRPSQDSRRSNAERVRRRKK
jgi:hypothetical protein